jgi:hypothetical protein
MLYCQSISSVNLHDMARSVIGNLAIILSVEVS